MEDRIDERTVLEAAEHVTVADLGGEAVVLDGIAGEYFGLNEVGAQVLALAEQSATVGDVLDRLFESYDVDPDQLRDDLFAFLGEMRKRRLIRVRGAEA